ncbi:MAG: DUF218 domain-containing protein [Clostridia bacterium]|nr:DUF218 domain-containing protein [Clostridia bacterium]
MTCRKKHLLIGLICVFVLLPALGFAALWGMNAYVESIGAQDMVEISEVGQADAVVILGAAVYNGKPSGTLARRLDKGLEVYQSGAVPKIIVSGAGGTRRYNEVDAMRNYLMERGVPAENIFMDHAGFNTYDSMVRAKEVFQVNRAVVVTQRQHLLRSLYIARRVGLSACGVDAGGYNEMEMRQQFWREALARVKAVLQCEITKPQPRYLGDPIPVSGSGLATEG